MSTSAAARNSGYYAGSVALLFGVPALGDFLFGYDIGATSYAVVKMNEMEYSPFAIGIVVSSPSTGALLAGFAVFVTADRIGRRAELRIAAVCYFLGALLESFSGLLSLNYVAQFVLLLLGRYIYGTGIAFGLHGSTTYVGEMVPSTVRGFLQSLQEASLVLGLLSGFLVGTLFDSSPSWTPLYAASLVVSGVMAVLSLLVIPGSARWLLWKGRTAEASRALHFVYTPDEAEKELQLIVDSLEQTAEGHDTTSPSEYGERLDEQQTQSSETTDSGQGSTTAHASILSSSLLNPAHWPALRAGLGLIMLLQLTGQPTVLSYAAPLLKQAGLSSSSTFWVSVFKFFLTMLAALLVEQFGRKTLLYSGTGMMLICVGFLAILSSSVVWPNPPNLLLLFSLAGYIAGYQIGFGTLIWLISSEVYPISVRGPAIALAVQSNFFLHSVVEACVPVLQSYLGWSFVFGVFGLTTAYTLYFVWRYIPETKGLSLEEIQKVFQDMGRQEAGSTQNDEMEPILSDAE